MKTINNNIQEAYCFFEVSKLLKEKGFNVLPEHIQPTDYVWGYMFDEEDEEDTLKVTEFQWEDAVQSNKFLRPTHAVAIEWLRVNFDIWISIELIDNSREFYFEPTIWTSADREYNDQDMIDQAKRISNQKEWRYNSPQEATEAALLYILTELIK